MTRVMTYDYLRVVQYAPVLLTKKEQAATEHTQTRRPSSEILSEQAMITKSALFHAQAVCQW